MNISHILLVFRKDGREILRDRRTLFVNVVLPALLYPFIAIFMIQVLQVTRSQVHELPRIALVDTASQLASFIDQQADEPGDGQAQPAPAGGPALNEHHSTVTVVALKPGLQSSLIRRAQALVELEDAGKQRPHLRAQAISIRQGLLAQLRSLDIAAAVLPLEGGHHRQRFLVIEDEAHVHVEIATQAIDDAMVSLRHALIAQRLHSAGLDENDLQLLSIQTIGLAPRAEAVRTHLAGIIPLLLVIMAAVGAFYPALDLIAGERERGTLESLLSWPAARQDIFIGKLLVTCSAAGLSVLLNLVSLAATAGFATSSLSAAGIDFGGAFSVGMGTLGLSLIALVPLTITLGALSLVLAGLAATAKEAQNYLTPLLLVVLVAAIVAAIPDTKANVVLDLVPITGSVLALKESLQAHSIPWVHLLLSTTASIMLAVVVVSWASRLLDSEHFAYPGLIRAGWGRFRRWGKAAPSPSGIEVMGVFAIAVAGMTFSSGPFQSLPPLWAISLPLVIFVLLPPLIHCWLGDYRFSVALRLRQPAMMDLLRAVMAIPFAIMVSSAIGAMQPAAPAQIEHAMEKALAPLEQSSWPLLLLCAAILPGICEEILCRGTLLSGFVTSVGKTGGVILAAFLFAALHGSPYRFLPQFVLGIALGILTLRARSLYPSMLLHAGHNAGILILQMSVCATLMHALDSVRPLAVLCLGLVGLIIVLMPSLRNVDPMSTSHQGSA